MAALPERKILRRGLHAPGRRTEIAGRKSQKIPLMGTMSSPCASTQARANCAGVQCLRCASVPIRQNRMCLERLPIPVREGAPEGAQVIVSRRFPSGLQFGFPMRTHSNSRIPGVGRSFLSMCLPVVCIMSLVATAAPNPSSPQKASWECGKAYAGRTPPLQENVSSPATTTRSSAPAWPRNPKRTPKGTRRFPRTRGKHTEGCGEN